LLAGAIGADGRLTPGVIAAPAVVIAAGGLGQAFRTTSNPAGATGDGIAVAARAGAVIRDLEFVQFHPTVLWLPGASGQCPLITEALRGAGAVLRELDGTPLMAGHDPRGDLAPRDVVAARMAEVIAAGDAGHVWLDATGLGRDLLEDGFPTVTAACRKHGIDPVHAMIPVAPGAHYSCGGIRADLDGRTTIPGLYAVGEAASTGIQGANRLGSNSVTEAIIAGRRTGTAIADVWAGDCGSSAANIAADDPQSRPKASGAAAGTAGAEGLVSGNPGKAGRSELAQAMSRCAGVMRDADGLAELLRIIGGWDEEHAAVLDAIDLELELEAVEAANLRAVSLLIAAGALRRAESRGCHRRRDATGTAAAPWHTLTRWDGEELVVTEEKL
jgi:L-aspartate oxidase